MAAADGTQHPPRCTKLLPLPRWLPSGRDDDPRIRVDRRHETRCASARNRGERRQQSSTRASERCCRTTATAGHTCFFIVAVTHRRLVTADQSDTCQPRRVLSVATYYTAAYPCVYARRARGLYLLTVVVLRCQDWSTLFFFLRGCTVSVIVTRVRNLVRGFYFVYIQTEYVYSRPRTDAAITRRLGYHVYLIFDLSIYLSISLSL